MEASGGTALYTANVAAVAVSVSVISESVLVLSDSAVFCAFRRLSQVKTVQIILFFSRHVFLQRAVPKFCLLWFSFTATPPGLSTES